MKRRGIVKGQTIEFDEPLGFLEGQTVEIEILPAGAIDFGTLWHSAHTGQ